MVNEPTNRNNEVELISFYEQQAPNINSTKEEYSTFFVILNKDFKIIKDKPILSGLYGSWAYEGWKRHFLPKDALKKSESLLKIAVEEIPQNTSYLYNLGLCLRSSGKASEAIEIGIKLLQIDESFKNIMLTGNCYADLNNSVEATKYYKKAIEIDSNQPELLYNLGHGLRTLKNYKDSLECFEKLIKIQPKSGLGYYGKGVVLVEIESFDEAERFLIKAKKFEGGSEAISKSLNILYNAIGKKEEAMKEQLNYGGAILLNDTAKKISKIKILWGERIEKN